MMVAVLAFGKAVPRRAKAAVMAERFFKKEVQKALSW